jgi:hypothetical protein
MVYLILIQLEIYEKINQKKRVFTVLAGFEPATYMLTACRSNLLSYRTFLTLIYI